MRRVKLFPALLLLLLHSSAWAISYEYAWSPGSGTEANPVIKSAFVTLNFNTGLVTNSPVVNVVGNVPLDAQALMLGGHVSPSQITSTGFEVFIGPADPGNDSKEFTDLLSGQWTYVPVPDANDSIWLLILTLGALVAFHTFSSQSQSLCKRD